jgi:RHS repeat-associated protein
LDDPSGSITSQTTRGFTGQEELADVGLVHLNGRVYDPLVGRMMSADPFVPDPMNGQAFNRYSYVINNPLALTDPNGYCFLGMCSWGKAISTFFGRTFGVLFREVPILGQIFEIAAVGLCTALGGGPACAAVAFASTTFVAGVTSGNLGYALRAGLIAGAQAIGFYAVGAIAGPNAQYFGTPEYLENVAGSALVGCASAAASGSKCGAGALSAGVSAAAGPFINGPNFALNVASHAVVGGLASVAGGGKFANGAVTGAFGYLFSPNAGGEGAYGFEGSLPTAPTRGLLGLIADALGSPFAVIAGGVAAACVALCPSNQDDGSERIYHRLGDSLDAVNKIYQTGELWGAPARNIYQSDIPKVKANWGPLQPGEQGFEFTTPVRPDQEPVRGGFGGFLGSPLGADRVQGCRFRMVMRS